MGTTLKLQGSIQETENVCVTQHVYTTNKAIIIIMEICKLPIYQNICDSQLLGRLLFIGIITYTLSALSFTDALDQTEVMLRARVCGCARAL